MRKPGDKAGRGVYITVRRYCPIVKKTIAVKGCGLRVYDWTTEEVQQILIRAFYEEQQRAIAAKERK